MTTTHDTPTFHSGNIETAVEGDRAILKLVTAGPETFGEELARLTLHEDEAVELATLLLLQVSKIRAARLEHFGLENPYGDRP